MQKEKIKQQKNKDKKARSESINMLIGLGLGALFYLIFGNLTSNRLLGVILAAVMAIIVVTILGVGNEGKK